MAKILTEDTWVDIDVSATISLKLPAGTTNDEAQKILSAAYSSFGTSLARSFSREYPDIEYDLSDAYVTNTCPLEPIEERRYDDLVWVGYNKG